MQKTIKMTLDNAIIRSVKEVDVDMTTNITETLPWIDYKAILDELEERSIAEGMAKGMAKGFTKGKAERNMEVALNLFKKRRPNSTWEELTQILLDSGISSKTITAARKQYEAKQAEAL